MYSLDVLLSQFGTSVLSMSSSNLLPDLHTDFSGGRSGGLVFPSLSEFSTVYVIHTVKGFGIVNKTEVDVFLELSCFFDDSTDVGNLISGSSAFSKSSLYMWKFSVHTLLKPSLKDFEHDLASMRNECNGVVASLNIPWHCPSLGLE